MRWTTADKEYSHYYFGYGKKASPFKEFACYCFGIAKERPFYNPEESNGNESTEVALINADLAMDFAGYLMNISKFNCNLDIKPPFQLKYPSPHFRKEMKKNLAWGHLTTPGNALIFELLLYRKGPGIQLCGTLDRLPASP